MNDKKKIIKQAADSLFRENGYKKTNISEIMKKAKLATGTFYLYYASKDEIFMEIYIEDNEKLKRKIMEEIDLNEHPMIVMEKMMRLNYQGMIESPILKEWYNRDNFLRMEQGFRANKGLESVDFLYSTFIEVVYRWQEKGVMTKDINAEMIMAIFGALINVETHKDEIGIQYFPELMEHLGKFIIKGLLPAE